MWRLYKPKNKTTSESGVLDSEAVCLALAGLALAGLLALLAYYET